jgi:hypothetical protein
MNLKNLFAPLALLCAVSFLTQCCSPPKPGIYANDQIPSSQRSKLHDLNKLLFEGLKANSKKNLGGVFSQEMIDDNSNLKTVEMVSNYNKVAEYSLMDEYYMVNTKKGNDTIRVTDKNVNNHRVIFDRVTPEMYLAFFNQKGTPNQWLVSALYCKLSYGWKLVDLSVNRYTQNGKTAMELCEYAKDRYAKGYLLDAVNAMALSRECMNPYGNWQYPQNQEMDSFYADLLNKANDKYTFPLVISQVSTQPKIFRVGTETRPDGVFPTVYYRSTVKLSDVKGIKKENDAIKKAIGQVLPGIDKDKKYIFFSAFNKLPNSHESVDRFEATDTLK